VADLRLRRLGGPVRPRSREAVDEDSEIGVVLAILVRRSDIQHVVTPPMPPPSGSVTLRIAGADRMLHLTRRVQQSADN
jgi:hypothetical protein